MNIRIEIQNKENPYLKEYKKELDTMSPILDLGNVKLRYDIDKSKKDEWNEFFTLKLKNGDMTLSNLESTFKLLREQLIEKFNIQNPKLVVNE